ncbi:helix-turn-helix domain-containing protein [Streptomyces sp. NBC_01433]|uniref:helix-turn-helix domain-containing protein n=1 Tax=Streptomyces sp. NBC_01433 TaxID=2903864 RepID=UPI002250500E|nr:helix-turn-helix transcriptional regulator [Streptomyces sp. NBC_01433]MCX4682218.1 helix-turn-helix domain-containing protein [Streptomyces sp. NBC_01433]
MTQNRASTTRERASSKTPKRATPTVMRRRVGAQIRRWREPMRSGEAAKLMPGWDTTKLSRIERGLYRISGDEVRDLCAKLGVDDAEGINEVAKVAEEPAGGDHGWWKAYESRVSQPLVDFVQLEARARKISTHHPVVVPGLLQTPGYVREIIGGMPVSVSPERAEMLVSIRLSRQEVLTRKDNPVQLHALVPESAFHAHFEAGPGIMRDQLRKLIDASNQPNVDLQVIPLNAHPAYGSNGATTTLNFGHPWVPVVSVDNPMGGTHSEDPEEIAYMENVFALAAAIALPVDESRDLITTYLEGQSK